MIDRILECAGVLNWNASTRIIEATRSKLSTGLNRAFLEVSFLSCFREWLRPYVLWGLDEQDRRK